MFGKEPELYYKTRSKKTSWIGRIFSVLFVTAYITFFIYKLIRMIKRTDVTFYDTFTYAEEPSKIKITNENFFGGFALETPDTYDPFIDETIYIPKAYFKRAERKGKNFVYDTQELELEPCKLENFGSFYQEKFKTKTLNNLYCFKKMDFILEGHFSYDVYSFFYIQFFPCVNTSEVKNCKPLEIIDSYLKNTFISFQWQDIELTPKNYSYPVRARDVDIYTTVGKRVFQEIHTYFQVVNIETDLDFLGFDEIENIKSEIFLKYDEMIIMSNIIDNDIYKTGESFCDFTIKLSENIRTERRTYHKLITILGDVGGLMEVLFTVFRIISSFVVDILYDISLVNNIFSFDLNKKTIIMKEKKSLKKHELPQNESPIIYNPRSPICKFSPQNTIIMNEEITTGTRNRMNMDTITKNNKLTNNNENSYIVKFENKRSHFKRKSFFHNNLRTTDNKLLKNKNLYISTKKNYNIYGKEEELKNHFKNNIENYEENNTGLLNIVNKIKMTRAYIYLCFCCVRKRKIIQNILLNEGMNIISEKLDIFNIFDKLYKDEKIQEKLLKNDIIQMSDECKINIQSIYNNLIEN